MIQNRCVITGHSSINDYMDLPLTASLANRVKRTSFGLNHIKPHPQSWLNSPNPEHLHSARTHSHSFGQNCDTAWDLSIASSKHKDFSKRGSFAHNQILFVFTHQILLSGKKGTTCYLSNWRPSSPAGASPEHTPENQAELS